MTASRVIVDLLVQQQSASRSSTEVIARFRAGVSWSTSDGFYQWTTGAGSRLLGYLTQFDEVICFGVQHYGFRVLGNTSTEDEWLLVNVVLPRIVDLQDLLRRQSGLRLGLNQVASATLGRDRSEWRASCPDVLPGLADCQYNVAIIRALDDFRRLHGFLAAGDLAVRVPRSVDERDQAA